MQRVSISLSSGFSFQGWIAKSPRRRQVSFNLVIERLLISGWLTIVVCRIADKSSFNLVIKRLLISGAHARVCVQLLSRFNLVIERLLISGNAPGTDSEDVAVSCFNLVIERLLISGQKTELKLRTCLVSISLSSGFSFQVSGRWACLAVGYR